MSHEHGGGDFARSREVTEAMRYNEEKRNRKLGRTAMHKIDQIIQEENENCALQQSNQEPDVLPEL